MSSIILYLSGSMIKARGFEESVTSFTSDSGIYDWDKIYFGDWIPLRNAANEIVGFKLVPLVKDAYLEKYILSANFVKLASNVTFERGKYPYISILIKSDIVAGEGMNHIEAAILRNPRNDFVVRLDGFSDEDWRQLGFKLD